MEEGDRDSIKNVRKKIYFLRVKSLFAFLLYPFPLIPFINFFLVAARYQYCLHKQIFTRSILNCLTRRTLLINI